MDKQTAVKIKIAVILFSVIVSGAPYSRDMAGTLARAVTPGPAYAADAQGDKSPYGGVRGGVYGEKKEVATAEEAERVFKEYFIKKDVKIGEIKEKELYFEAEIRDSKDKLIDKVIVDKRTGRIRSIY